ncbi:hypothetical protein O1611_g62 [Lasiodiplodia mahajangana]|uniref:Uncharacterized protein n=1 Tax=Lasiodiplodia mahajangana TaxID=1108764 RepID=A0ACC2K219_9PEZI|nr:hypothetical protein O1611_g62 [Lasiodiplodia mahajangana]
MSTDVKKSPRNMDNSPPPESLWLETYDRCLQKLPPKDVSKILQVTSYEELKDAVSSNNQNLMNSTLPRMITKIEPFLSSIRQFFSCIDTFVSSNPQIAALIWGSIRFLFELTGRVSNALKEIADGLVELSTQMPHFEAYRNMFGKAARLNRALPQEHFKLVKVTHGAKSGATTDADMAEILMNVVLKNYGEHFQAARAQIAKAARFVDVEAVACNMELDGLRFEQVMSVLNRSDVNESDPKPAVKFPCHQIPYSRNLTFFARSQELDLCYTTLIGQSVQDPNLRWLALHGDGGVGKTSIALEFLHRNMDAFDIIAWFHADKIFKLEQDFKELSSNLGLHKEGADSKADELEVLSFLSNTTRGWIMVFDNVEHDFLIQDHVPKTGSGSILLTSRDPELQYGTGMPGCRVASFSQEDSAQFLLQSLPRSNISDPLEQAATEVLLKDLGGLPLGIRQIGNFIRESGSSIQECVALLADKAEEQEILSDESGLSRVPYSSSISKTWQASVSQLDRTSLSILSTLAFFDPDGIQSQFTKGIQQITAKCRDLFPDAASSVVWLRSVRHLLRRGLIEQMQSGRMVRIHRLVQRITLLGMSNEERQRYFDIALEVIEKDHPQSQDTGAHGKQTLSPYTLYRDSNTVRSRNSRYLLEKGHMEKALVLARCAEQQVQGNGAEADLQRGALYNTYGVVALQHGNHGEAETWFRRTKLLRERHMSNTHVLVIRAQDVIDELTQMRKAIDENETLPIRDRSAVDDFLAEAHLFLGNYDTAWMHLQRSISMTRDSVPLESQGSGYYYFIQGNIRCGQGRFAEAFQYHSLGLEVRKKVLGDHIQTAGSCFRVGDLHAKLGNLPQAIQILLEAKRMYGSLSLVGNYARGGMARVSWRLAKVYADLGKQEESLRAEEDAMRLFREVNHVQMKVPSTDDFEALVPPLDR